MAAFISVINKKFLRTFYSVETASNYHRTLYSSRRVDQDELKSKALSAHPDVYKNWGDELVRPWTLKNWARWEEEQPSWFSDAWIANVPNDYIPYDFRVKYKKTKERVEMRRRSSLAQVRRFWGAKKSDK